jgi:uncharacterized protein (DUF2235 family)
MALYAFDGTWNEDGEEELRDSNVCKFRDAYAGEPKVYFSGIGTRLGLFGKVIGGVTGAGGRVRIQEAMDDLIENVRRGDSTIDIVGFSRGAAMALQFANRIEAELPDSEIRFLGLWDTVASFGLPGNTIDLKWTFTLPDNVRACYHAMALDERRGNFPLTRVKGSNTQGAIESLQEVWFRGVHSDVGGAKNLELSCIALCWMLERATKRGLPIDQAAIERWKAFCNENGAVSADKDPVKDPWRTVDPGDVVHKAVRSRTHVRGVENSADLSQLSEAPD